MQTHKNHKKSWTPRKKILPTKSGYRRRSRRMRTMNCAVSWSEESVDLSFITFDDQGSYFLEWHKPESITQCLDRRNCLWDTLHKKKPSPTATLH